ncbi:uncharacterized protein LOC124309441 [Neodiprion virginianus]|uniref:uncharacterized protein LOC124309441 n=1 Tax=Neodiprion virginianus TaxID=2961670 RepID=UPI001EE6F707|nr:uncharacterized protein LOC124309441 [Neodiprion virginianus]
MTVREVDTTAVGLEEGLPTKAKHISVQLKRYITKSDCVPPRAYGLPKIHQQDVPLRIIVSFTNSPTFNLARTLSKWIGNNIVLPASRFKDSFVLVEGSSKFSLPPNYTLISLDVVSLFTNVPQDLAIDAINSRWSQLSNNVPVPLRELINALNICVKATIFKFNNTNYAQTYGLPMGSPLSPILSDLVMDDLEQCCIKKLDFALPFYLRYVDDIITVAPNDKIETLLEVFNSFHPRLQFTIEPEINGRMSFLDVLIIDNNQLIKTDWYHKSTWSQSYLNYRSLHRRSYKTGMIYCLVDRAIRLSSSEFHNKNLSLIYDALPKNDYPALVLQKHIQKRHLSILSSNDFNHNDLGDVPVVPKNFVSIPYLGGVSQCSNRHAEAYNRYMGEAFDPEVEESYLMYFDVNNLHGAPMSFALPCSSFEWVSDFSSKLNMEWPACKKQTKNVSGAESAETKC